MMQLRTNRHNAVLKVVLDLARQAGYGASATNHPWKHIRMSPELRLLRPDASILPGRSRSRNLLLDVAITHPCAPTLLAKAAETPLHAVSLMLRVKHLKYKDLAATIDYGFVGLVMETYGAMAKEFQSLL